MSSILVAGCGDVGTAVALLLSERGHDVWGLRRRPELLPKPIRPLAGDLARDGALPPWPTRFDQVFYTAAADGSDEASYRAAYLDGMRNLLRALVADDARPARFFFTSSVGVYGQREGEWVDESSETKPSHSTGRIMLAAEALLRDTPFPVTIVRLAGIYGPGRGRLLDGVTSGEIHCGEGPPTFTNRIHRDDCAGFLTYLAGQPQPERLYVGVDDDPADRCTVLHWLAAANGAPSPHRPHGSPAKRDRGGNKRCRNSLLHESGYRLLFPTFREGYRALIESRRGAQEGVPHRKP